MPIYLNKSIKFSPRAYEPVKGFIPANNDRNEFHLVEWTLNPIRKWLIALIASAPPLYQGAYLARSVTIAVFTAG